MKLQHRVDMTALALEHRNRIHFISNSISDNLFSATEINEELEEIAGLRLWLLNLKLNSQ
jgi:hypothetical protein